MKTLSLLLAGTLCAWAFCAPPEPRTRELDRQVDLLAGQITACLDERKIATLAVIDFPNLDGKLSDLGRYLTEELTTRLFRAGRVRLVERQQLKRVLEEQKLAASGFLDEASAARLGRVLGVEALATGTVADLDTTVKINARILASETGAVIGAATVSVPVTREVEVLLGRAGEAATARFDGAWEVEIACMVSSGAQGYNSRFPAEVKGGVLHGQWNTEGVPPCLTLDGRIHADGTATILATGLTGDPRYTLKRVRPGSRYSFHIEAVFSDRSGTGRRLEARPCTINFTRKGAKP